MNGGWQDGRARGSLVGVGRAIGAAAVARGESRGAHFRADYPATGDLAASTYTRVRLQAGKLAVDAVSVRFTRIRPGASLLLNP